MNRITEVHIFVQCALRLFDSFNSETTKINYQFLIIVFEIEIFCDRQHNRRHTLFHMHIFIPKIKKKVFLLHNHKDRSLNFHFMVIV